ncbi:hypothetical protein MKK55_08750 [Methylobacterium sp. J-059]|uniref:hypothetical protein n=1 Tax=Methylobacterium sp. J-059 TaxID=2836643 RepID=UPI001FB98B61|nr:hypothetical protein [Methylobacterium sp. J-059]MCJ2039041.1 hypothetical protein [Methylobacterium sp. J-059]
MGDDVRAQIAMDSDATMKRNLRRIADALGVPASEFYGPLMLDQQVLTLLTLVQTYLGGADPAARERFMQAVQAIGAQYLAT